MLVSVAMRGRDTHGMLYALPAGSSSVRQRRSSMSSCSRRQHARHSRMLRKRHASDTRRCSSSSSSSAQSWHPAKLLPVQRSNRLPPWKLPCSTAAACPPAWVPRWLRAWQRPTTRWAATYCASRMLYLCMDESWYGSQPDCLSMPADTRNAMLLENSIACLDAQHNV